MSLALLGGQPKAAVPTWSCSKLGESQKPHPNVAKSPKLRVGQPPNLSLFLTLLPYPLVYPIVYRLVPELGVLGLQDPVAFVWKVEHFGRDAFHLQRRE